MPLLGARKNPEKNTFKISMKKIGILQIIGKITPHPLFAENALSMFFEIFINYI